MGYPVAMIPYVNMAPYRAAGCPPGCEFVSLVPSASVEALAAGKVAAAAVPVGALPRLADRVQPLGAFGIAGRARTMSVLFFSEYPMAEMTPDDHIDYTVESTSSVRLLRLLLERQSCPRSGTTRRPGAPARGILEIGDRALVRFYRHRHRSQGHEEDHHLPWVADLATEWFRFCRLPFVFARWVVRTDAPDACKQVLLEWLNAFGAEEADHVRRAVPVAAEQIGLPEQLIARYFRVIRRCLQDDDLNGQQLFLDMQSAWRRSPAATRPNPGTVPDERSHLSPE